MISAPAARSGAVWCCFRQRAETTCKQRLTAMSILSIRSIFRGICLLAHRAVLSTNRSTTLPQAPALAVGRPVNDAGNACMDNGPAHIAQGSSVTNSRSRRHCNYRDLLRRGAQCRNLDMRRRVADGDLLIEAAPDEDAILDDHRPYRHPRFPFTPIQLFPMAGNPHGY